MGERALDTLTGLIFIIIILGLQYLNIDMGLAKPFVWVFAILFHAYVFGKRSLPDRHRLLASAFGLILLFAAQSVAQTIWYYAGGSLNQLSDAWCLVLAMATSHMVGLIGEQSDEFEVSAEEQPLRWTNRRIAMAICLAAASAIGSFFVIHNAWLARTVQAIRTPWPLLPSGTLAAVALLWIVAAISAIYLRSYVMTGLQSLAALGSTLFIAPLVYRLGYGFDGFLHLAGERVLLATGTLNPKPFYYIGQYVFTTWLARVTQLNLADIDRWLVPVMAALLLAASVSLAFEREAWHGSSAAALALFPLGAFVATTPQGLAMALGLSALILSLGSRQGALKFSAVLWLGIWSVTVHPLAGIPLLGLATAVHVMGRRPNWVRHLSWPIAVIAGLAIPAVFYVASYYGSALNIDWNLGNALPSSVWADQLRSLMPWLGDKYVLWPAWSSLVALSLPALGLTACIASILLTEKNDRLTVILLVLGAICLLFSAGLLDKASDFAFLIQYEKGDYAQRLRQIAVFVLLIGGWPAIGKLLHKLKTAVPLATAGAVILLGSIGAANAYNALPRHDAVQPSRGWSTSADDVEAVRWIDRYAKGRDYTVLADQSVSAAAVNEFGFKRYAGDIFFYPIPTGGPLYQSYLKMTYEDPSWDTVRDAAKLGKSDLVFVVINDYWWKATELNESIVDIAHDSWNIDNGKVEVYVFDLTKPEPKPTAKTP